MIPRAKSAVVAASLALVLGAVVGSAVTLGADPATDPPEVSAESIAPASTPPSPNTGEAPIPIEQPAPNQDEGAAVEPDFQVAGRLAEMDFVPVKPCRLVDTRLAGGALNAGALRNFDARGTGSLASQGGSATGCGLPANAASMSVTVVGVKPAKGGYLRSWAFSTTEPLSSFMNVTKNVTIAGFTNQELSQPGTLFDFVVRNGAGKLHLVIDVSGYYIAPLAAEVNINGTLKRGSRVTSVVHVSTGQYRVFFDRDVSACFFQTSTPSAGVLVQAVLGAEPLAGQPTGVFVIATNGTPAVTDIPFYLVVTC